MPVDAAAVSANLTVTDTRSPGFLTTYPNGASRPRASTINWASGETLANALTGALGTDGKLAVFNVSSGVDVVLDVNGYYR